MLDSLHGESRSGVFDAIEDAALEERRREAADEVSGGDAGRALTDEAAAQGCQACAERRGAPLGAAAGGEHELGDGTIRSRCLVSVS